MNYTQLSDTPVGPLLLAGDAAGLRFLLFNDRGQAADIIEPHWKNDARFFANTTDQLEAYFAGELTEFDVSLAASGTDFQKTVWNALNQIPWGTTATYGQIAKTLGRPSASRAVGLANGRNPISIIVPCHRVIGASRKLVGYGGGLPHKETLLKLEGCDIVDGKVISGSETARQTMLSFAE